MHALLPIGILSYATQRNIQLGSPEKDSQLGSQIRTKLIVFILFKSCVNIDPMLPHHSFIYQHLLQTINKMFPFISPLKQLSHILMGVDSQLVIFCFCFP